MNDGSKDGKVIAALNTIFNNCFTRLAREEEPALNTMQVVEANVYVQVRVRVAVGTCVAFSSSGMVRFAEQVNALFNDRYATPIMLLSDNDQPLIEMMVRKEGFDRCVEAL